MNNSRMLTIVRLVTRLTNDQVGKAGSSPAHMANLETAHKKKKRTVDTGLGLGFRPSQPNLCAKRMFGKHTIYDFYLCFF